jgi:hypothetical protein
MALRCGGLAALVALLGLGLAACGGRATAPDDAGPEDGRTDAQLPDGSRPDRTPDSGVAACGLYPGGECPGGAVCDVHGCYDGASGLCLADPGGCADLYAPVCGCDWVTYPNDCERVTAGVALSYAGPCAAPDGGPGCLDDDLEPNNTPASATSLDGPLAGHPQGVSLYGLEICTDQDLDYYSFRLTSTKAATLLVQFVASSGLLSATLLDAGLGVVAVGTPLAGGLQATASLGAGTYYVQVGAGNNHVSNTYDFALTFQ